jgi:hypothetical protein
MSKIAHPEELTYEPNSVGAKFRIISCCSVSGGWMMVVIWVIVVIAGVERSEWASD